MRYLIQLVVPALIFAGVVYLLTRRRRHDLTEARQQGRDTGSDTRAFIVILVVSGAVALGTAYLLTSMLES